MPDESPDHRLPVKVRPASAWDRDFSLLWGGAATSQLGSISAATAGPLLALTLTGSPVFAGWVTAASTVPSLLLQVPAGLFVDRWNRRFIMLASQLIRLAAAMTLVLGLALLDSHTALRALLLIAAATDGAFSVFYNVAEITALQHVVKPESRPDAMAKNEARRHIALLLGRPLGGFLFGIHRAIPYLFDAFTCLVSVITIYQITVKDFRPDRNSAPPKRRPAGRVMDGFRHLINDPVLRTVLVVCTVTNFFFQTIVLLLVVSAQRAGMSSSLIGLLLASSGLGGLLGSMAAPWVVSRLQPGIVVLTCVWSWLPLALVIAVSDQPAVGLLAWGSLSFMGAHLNVALAVRQMDVPEELLGRVASINSLFTSGSVSLGAFVAGYTITVLSTQGAADLVVWVIAIMAIGATISISMGSLQSRHDDPISSDTRRGRDPDSAHEEEQHEEQHGVEPPLKARHAINA